MKIKIITGMSVFNLEDSTNLWLNENKGKIDVVTVSFNESSLVILYKERKSDEELKRIFQGIINEDPA